MFLSNKYTSLYYKIIYNTTSDRSGYTEKHHIIPRSLGGTDDISNLAVLNAREHFICHWLLTKMVDGPPKYKMVHALRLMCGRDTYTTPHRSRIYESTKQAHAESMSQLHKGKTLSEDHKRALLEASSKRVRTQEQKNHMSQKLKGRIFSEEARKKMSDAAKARKRQPMSEETKRKIAQSNSKPHSEERKRNISEAHKRRRSTSSVE